MGPCKRESNRRRFVCVSKKWIILLGSIIFASAGYTNPVLDNIGAGTVSIQEAPNSTVINQSSQKAIINWHSFNIGQPESVHFQQPAGGIALNRISPVQGPSSIYGRLTATGQIILMNPAGIFFGPTAYVNVGGLIATTGHMTDQQFLNGSQYHFSNASAYNGAIINQGHIVAHDHGLIALVGNNVQNSGVIEANLGKVVLSSGNAFTMNFDGSNLINFTVDEKALGANRGVTNTGTLSANGGQVLVSAKAAQNVLDNVINLEGIVEAKSVGVHNGEIILSGDPDAGYVRVAAKINASGKGVGEKGGKVHITGNKILIDEGTEIDASGTNGGGQVLIGGNYHGYGPLPNAQATVFAPTAKIYADAIENGDGGEVVLWADDITRAYGTISARGGALGGNGGFIETSGHNWLDVAGIKIDTSAPYGQTGNWLLDPSDLTISTTPTTDVAFNGTDLFTADNNATISNLNVTDLTNALLNSDVTVLTTSGGTGLGQGDIIQSTAINWSGAHNLTLDAFHDIQLFFDITGNGNLTLNAGNVINFVGAITVSTNGSQTYNDPVLLIASPTILTSTNNGNITFNSTLNSNDSAFHTITINTGGITQFNGIVGTANNFALGSLTTDAPGSTNINTSTIRTWDNETHNDPVNLLTNVQLLNLSGGGAVTFNNTVNGAQSLTIGSALNSVTSVFNGAIGGLTPLTSFTTSAGSTVTFSGGEVTTSGSQTYGNPVTLAADTAFNAADIAFNDSLTSVTPRNATINITSTSTISGTLLGGINLIKAGAGTLILSNTGNNYGSTTINAGTLQTGASEVIPNSSAVTLANIAGASLDLAGFTETIGSLSGGGTTGGNVSIGSGGILLTGGNNSSTTYAGVISGTGGFGALWKQGTGTFTLSGINTFTGDIALVDGVLQLGTSNAINSTNALLDLGAGAAVFDLNNFNQTVASINGAFGTTLGSGTLTVNPTTAATYSGVMSGSGSLIKSGSATFTMSGANTYQGTTTVNNGTLAITNPSGLGSTAGGTTVNSGATLQIDNANIGNEAITLAGATLDGNNVAVVTGPITLSSGTSNTISSGAGDDFTLSGGINGGGNLTLSDLGSILIEGGIGTTTRIGSLTTTDNTAIIGSVLTTGDQIYNNEVIIEANKTYDSSGGNITFNRLIDGDGNFDFTVISGGTTTFADTIGAGIALNSLTVDASAITMNGGSVRTLGNQSYSGLLTLGADTTFTTTGSGNVTVAINSGIAGNRNATFAGGASSNETYMLTGSMAVNNLTVDGNGGTNTLAVNSGSAQTWNLTSTDSGNITGISGVTGSFSYSDIQNLTGGSSNNNNFIFADGVSVSGTLNGGSLAHTNSLNYTAYTTPVNVVLSSTNDGIVSSNGLGDITTFTNINNFVNNGFSNAITLPNKTNTLTITGAKVGFINDPLFFSGFQRFFSASGRDRVTFTTAASTNPGAGTAIVNGVTMFFSGFIFDPVITTPSTIPSVASIIEQGNNPGKDSTSTAWVMTTVTNNINDIISEFDKAYEESLSKIKINPYCTGM